MDSIEVLSMYESKGRLHELVLSSVEKHFKTKFDYLPNFYVRVPGRVNLIGEHIDYCGFSVLPMAIELDIVLAVGVNSFKQLNLANLDFEKYKDFTCSMESFEIDISQPKWYNYFLCGVKGIIEEFGTSAKGMDVAIKGTIPPASGLSSSSALVCAAALATAFSNRIPLTRLKMANLCASSERFIGTMGGGMDQAIAFLAEAGAAKLIKFFPLEARSVFLPAGANFIVANSCAPLNKSETAHFNTRVVECKLATKVLAKKLSLNIDEMHKLKDIPDSLPAELDDMSNIVKKTFHVEPYTRQELCEILEMSDKELQSNYMSENTRHLSEFKLYQRALHVFEEANRVMRFSEISQLAPKDAMDILGKLMTESHVSCRDLYECSHSDLDELVDLALKSGALGARLTGAGWGGCCVCLVPADKVVKFVEELKNKFYLKTKERSVAWPTNLFASKPGPPAGVFTC